MGSWSSNANIQTSNLKGALPVCTISLLSNKIIVQTLNKGVPKLKTSLSGSQMAEEKQECIPAGCAPSTGVAILVGGGVCLEGCLPGGLCVCPGGGGVPAQGVVLETPPVNRITERCKNITLPQLRCGR